MADKNYDALYQYLQKMKSEILNEVRFSSAQVSSTVQDTQNIDAIMEELRYIYKQNQNVYEGVSSTITDEVGGKLDTMSGELDDVKYSCKQLQSEYEGLSGDVASNGEDYKKLSDAVEAYNRQVLDAVAAIPAPEGVDYNRIVDEVGDKLLELLNSVKEETVEDPVDYEKIIDGTAAKVAESLPTPETVDYERIIVDTAEKVVESLPTPEAVDYEKIIDGTAEKVVESLPAPEAVDYERIVVDTAEKVVESLPTPQPVDYDKLIGGTAEKVVESLPYPERVDYARIEEYIAKAVAAATLNVDALASAVAEKIIIPAPVMESTPAPEIDYEHLADLVAAKLAAKEQSYDVILDEEGIEAIADRVAAKIGKPENIDYDKVCLAAQAAQILPDPVDYDRIAEIVEDKVATETTYDLIIDEEGISAIAKGVSEELKNTCCVCEAEPVAESVEEEPVEEAQAEEASVEETPVEEAPVEETVEETVEEAPVEEVAEETPAQEPVQEELAVAVADHDYQEAEGGDLIDAETGLVIRLKRSFTAKMRQSDERVKEYYSSLKNELVSYKRVNSNISWHGDRFNFGRETVAKINICGKTLCFYLALDPNAPEYKTTVYHQKDVGSQKAYENTPFMVKVKSDAAVKKALRLVGYLADKLGTEKEENFEAVNYVEEFGYESTKQLFDEGFIKATKEKKVDLDF